MISINHNMPDGKDVKQFSWKVLVNNYLPYWTAYVMKLLVQGLFWITLFWAIDHFLSISELIKIFK